ncbi:MAG: response regulator transcription factor [Bacteroidota bacterium]
MPTTSIILADTHFLIRRGLNHLLSNVDEFEVIGESTNEKALMESVRQNKPQVVIMDHAQGEDFSIETVRQVRQQSPGTNVMIVSADNNQQTIFEVINGGACSFLTKHCGQDEIINGVKAAAKGEKFFCGKVLNLLLERSFGPTEDDDKPVPLSSREIEIVRLIAQGKIAKEIASELHLSTHTIYTHRKNIMKKLRLRSTSELVVYAIQNGIITPDAPN